jgi:2-hydroxymuconate-semialdehyde hydrolase
MEVGDESMSVISRRVKTGSYESYMHEGGKGNSETIIFLHGSGPGASAQANWKHILPQLSDKFHVVAPDILGFADTDHPIVYPKNGAQWMTERVNQVLNLMDSLKVEKVHLVGNSLGGVIALHLAMYAPERFDRIVLMGAGGGLTQPTPELAKLANFHKDPNPVAFKNLLRWFLYDDTGKEELLDNIVAERLQIFEREDVRKSYEENFSKSQLSDMLVPPSALKRMKNPFLLIHGHQDRFVPLESSLYVLDYLEDAELHVFKKCGHWAMIEQEEQFVKLIREFFNRTAEVTVEV